MTNLEQFINDDGLSDVDPLVKMAVIHHQFESIHPFYDGNGRTGRIINILYWVAKGLGIVGISLEGDDGAIWGLSKMVCEPLEECNGQW